MLPKPRRWRASAKIQKRAQELRREMTPAEKKLWARIRFKQLNNFYFRKQHAVGRFVVDFFCAKAKLVKVDGDTHADQVAYDEERTRWLKEQKQYRVIRFTNEDVNRNIEGVLMRIVEAVSE